MPAARWTEMYGTNHCPAIQSLTVGIAVLSTACAPDVMGWLIGAAVGLETAVSNFLRLYIYLRPGFRARASKPLTPSSASFLGHSVMRELKHRVSDLLQPIIGN